MAKRIVKRILVEEESDDITKVYRRVWEEVPDKPAPTPPPKPVAKAKPAAKKPKLFTKKKEK